MDALCPPVFRRQKRNKRDFWLGSECCCGDETRVRSVCRVHGSRLLGSVEPLVLGKKFRCARDNWRHGVPQAEAKSSSSRRPSRSAAIFIWWTMSGLQRASYDALPSQFTLKFCPPGLSVITSDS